MLRISQAARRAGLALLFVVSTLAATQPDVVAATAPRTPTDLVAVGTSISQISLAWTDNSQLEAGYSIERATSSDGPWTAIAESTANVSSYSDTGLTPGATYYYRVRAFTGQGVSAHSNTAIATTISPAMAAPAVSAAAATVPVSRGIYMLDDKSGTYRMGSLWQADRSYIDGYVWRISWTDMDTGIAAPKYHLDAVDTAVSELQALSNNQNNRMKLSLAFNAMEVPRYVLNSAKEKYKVLLFGNNGSVMTSVPWDASSQTHFRNFVQAVANHPVYDAVSNKTIAFRDHPALAQVVAPIIGQQWYRDQGNLTGMSSYTRTKYTAAILANIHIVRDAFPNKPVYMGFFSLNDNTRSPTLDSAVLSAIMNEFNGVKNPRIGFFQELLRGDAPSTAGSYGQNLLTARAGGNPVLFQACSPWLTKNLCSFTRGDNTPENGLNFGNHTYGAKYFEMYAADLNSSKWVSMFTQWHNFLQTAP